MKLSDRIHAAIDDSFGRSMRDDLKKWAEAARTIENAIVARAQQPDYSENDETAEFLRREDKIFELPPAPDFTATAQQIFTEARELAASQPPGHVERYVEEPRERRLELPADPIRHYIERIEMITMEELQDTPVNILARTATLAALYQAKQLERIADTLDVMYSIRTNRT
jgi:hypothetical protein